MRQRPRIRGRLVVDRHAHSHSKNNLLCSCHFLACDLRVCSQFGTCDNAHWFWSGCPYSRLAPFRLVFSVFRGQQKQFTELRRRASRSSPWRDVLSQFELAVRGAGYRTVPPNIGQAEHKKLIEAVGAMSRNMKPDRISASLAPIVAAYTQYSGESLRLIFRRVKTTLEEWHSRTLSQIQRDAFELDRKFGGVATVRATRLGNVIDAYNQYCDKRYNIYPEIFWPRLRGAIREQDKYLELIDDPAILLDFSLAMASLSALYGLLALFLGPWLWNHPLQWVILAAAGFVVAWFFYTVAVSAAMQSGEFIRATFDLFRLQLMGSLRRPWPPNLQAERAQWAEVSSLAAYGNVKAAEKFILDKN